MLPRIIGICGSIGAGKDTVGAYIREFYPQYKKESFATTLKKAVAVLYGWDYDMLLGVTPETRKQREEVDSYWTEKFGYNVTPRKVMQQFGRTMRNLNSSFWVYSLERNLPDFCVITDARYPEELDMIKRNGGIIIQVNRFEKPEWWDKAVEYNIAKLNNDISPRVSELKSYLDSQVHESEYSWVGINNPDFIVNNYGTLDELKLEVEKICKNYE